MAALLLEGFEIFSDGATISETEIQNYLLAVEPDAAANWRAAGIIIDDTEYRVEGQSLKLERLEGNTFDDDWAFNLGFAFSDRQVMATGFATKFDKRPTKAVPIMQFRYDGGEGAAEQCSLWISEQGKLFFSGVEFQAEYSQQGTPTTIPTAASPVGVFRFGVWNYIEVLIDYSEATPVANVRLNGYTVIENVQSAALKKQTAAYMSSVHYLSPGTQFFGDDFNHWFDDIYIASDAFLGPILVKMLTISGTASSAWSGTPGSGDFPDDTSSATSDAGEETALFDLEDLPVGVPGVLAVEVQCIASQGDDELGGLRFGVKSSDGGSVDYYVKQITVVTSTPQMFRNCLNQLPAPHQVTLTEAGVNAQQIMIKSENIV